MKDADEGADEVVRVRIGPEIAAGNSALDRGHEGALDERAGAFH